MKKLLLNLESESANVGPICVRDFGGRGFYDPIQDEEVRERSVEIRQFLKNLREIREKWDEKERADHRRSG